MLEDSFQILARWDGIYDESSAGSFSLRTHLKKLFSLHEQFVTLLDVALSARFRQFFDGYFAVRTIQPDTKDLILDLSLDVIGPFIFLPWRPLYEAE